MVARWQLLELGLSRGQIQLRIERGLLRPLFVGVYAVGHGATTREARWLAGVLATGGGGVLGHLCAGEHLGILRPRPSAVVHVISPRGMHGRRGLVVHRNALLTHEWILRDCIPVTSPERTLLDLAASLQPHQLQRAVHEAEVQRLCQPAGLREMLELHPGARGSKPLREILDMAGGRALPTRSELEDRYLRFLVDRSHRLPQTNVYLNTPRGRFEVDCYWPDARLVVELDGARYHQTEIAKARDGAKDRALAALGLRVMHVTWRMLEEEAEDLDIDTRFALAAVPRKRD